MNTKRKNILRIFLIAFVCEFTAMLVNSCSNDELYTNDAPATEQEMAQTHRLISQLSNNRYLLLDSIANSDELLEFKIRSELLAEKFRAYTETLTQEEYDEIMENLNNDEFMEELIDKANLMPELQELDKAVTNLHENTAFLQLSDDEQMWLYEQISEQRFNNNRLMKTREEVGNINDCEKQRQEAYKQAETAYQSEIEKCNQNSGSLGCYTRAMTSYIRMQDLIDIEYSKCIERQSHTSY